MHKSLNKKHLQMQFVEFVTATPRSTSFKGKRGPLNCGILHSQWHMLNLTHWAFNSHNDLKVLEKRKENLFFVDKVNHSINSFKFN